MLVQGINLPEKLLRAQAAGELVVFIGAGVSAPAPSSLPLFDELAQWVGEGTGMPRQDDESVDRYFGRLKLRGVKVHKAVARILLDPNSRPHELHTLLTKLFPEGTPVRLVTTNFDTHLSTTLEQHFGSSVDMFYAPALPLGDDFAGLVYLHGSAEKNAEQCVLTDEDFGRAYLNRAWATRFLEAMFQRYSVLFVGYRHSDPVMIYLARGLSPSSRKPRYAFTTGDPKALESWKVLDVEPLIYPLGSGENAHEKITHCVRDWSLELHRGLLEKAERIRAISETQPPLEGEDADYLKFCLANIETARVFFRYASDPEWISWLEKNRFLISFFDLKQAFGDFERELGFWLIDKFFVDHAQHVLAAIQRHGSRIHLEWAWRLWQRLIRRQHDANIDTVFSGWVALLLMQPYDVLSSDDWSMLLAECHFPEDSAVAMQLFVRVTAPRLTLKEHWAFLQKDAADQPKVDFELNLLHDADHYLSDAWTKTIGRHLDSCGPSIAPQIFANLVAADNLMRLCNSGREGIDPFWLHRQSIEKRGGRALITKLDSLIDAARDVVAQRVTVKPNEALAHGTDLFASKVPILQRLAVFAVARIGASTADEKLTWLLQHNLVYQYKTDVFRLLELSYPKASDDLRQRVIDVVSAGPTGALFDGISEDTRLYERFNLLVWLRKVAPQCDLTRSALEALQRLKPEFRERERPDVDFSYGEARWLDASEGFNVDEITSQEIAGFLASCPPLGTDNHFDSKRSRYCSSISAAASQRPEWAMRFLNHLASSEIREEDLWSSAIVGLCSAKLSAETWATFLQFASSVAAPAGFFETTTDLLERGSVRETDTLPDELMPAAQRVAERIWSESLQYTKPTSRQMEDWLVEAINRPGGKLARFWLERVSSAKRTDADKWRGIPIEIAEALRTVLRDSSQAAAHARVVVASQLHYLFSIDPAFAQAELLPLFDWTRNATTAEQCWHGFVMWGRWLPGFTEQLLPSFNQMVARAASEKSDNIRHATIMQITVLALYRLPDPLSKNWLPNVIRTLEKEELAALAAEIDHALSNADAPTVEGIWDRWLKRYWEERILGRPKPFSLEEARHTGCWALSAGKHFPEAVELVAALKPRPRFEHMGFLSRVDSKALAQKFPASTADLLLIYLSAPDLHLYADDTLQNIWRALVQEKLPPEHLRKVREAIFRFGPDPNEWT
jgi:hypothetical protein